MDTRTRGARPETGPSRRPLPGPESCQARRDQPGSPEMSGRASRTGPPGPARGAGPGQLASDTHD